MQIIYLALNEIRLLVSCRRELALHLVLPVLVVSLVAALFSGEPALYGDFYVVNQDGGRLSRIFMDRLEEAKGIKVQLLDYPEARRRLERGEALAVLEVPPGFSEKVSAGVSPGLTFYLRGTGGEGGQAFMFLARTVLTEMLGETQLSFMIKDYTAGSPYFQREEDLEFFLQGFFWDARRNLKVELQEKTLGQDYSIPVFMLPGVVTLFIIFTLTFSAQRLVEEKEHKILDRLQFSGLSPGKIFLGRFLGTTLRGLLLALVLFLAAQAWTGCFTPVSLARTLLFSLLVAAAAGSVSMFIGSLAHKPTQALWAGVIFSLVNSALGNTFAYPRDESLLVQWVNQFTLSLYANQGFRQLILQGAPLGEVYREAAALLAFILLFSLGTCGALKLAR